MILPPQADWMNDITAKSRGWFILVWSFRLRWRTQWISIVLHPFCWSIFLMCCISSLNCRCTVKQHVDRTRNGGAILLQMTEPIHRVQHHTDTMTPDGSLWPNASGWARTMWIVLRSLYIQFFLLSFIGYWLSINLGPQWWHIHIHHQQTMFTQYVIPRWWRQRHSLKLWSLIPNWCNWSPEKILSLLVPLKDSRLTC
jgi:hypothetical protein